MKVNKIGIITDFEDIDKELLLNDTRLLMYHGEITEDIRNLFFDWRKQYGLDGSQDLLCMSTVFPMRILDSLLEDLTEKTRMSGEDK
jgi:hypothetical protein